MKKKRQSLAEFQAGTTTEPQAAKGQGAAPTPESDILPKYVHKSVYIPPAVLDQLDLLAINEKPAPGRKKKFNSLIMEGLDLLLKDRGLPSIHDLTTDK